MLNIAELPRGADALGLPPAAMKVGSPKRAGEGHTDAIRRFSPVVRFDGVDHQGRNPQHQTDRENGYRPLLTPPPLQRLRQPTRLVLHDHRIGKATDTAM